MARKAGWAQVRKNSNVRAGELSSLKLNLINNEGQRRVRGLPESASRLTMHLTLHLSSQYRWGNEGPSLRVLTGC